MNSGGKRRRGLSYEDRVLWAHVTKAIKPLGVNAAAPDDGEVVKDSKIPPTPPAKRAAKAAPPIARKNAPPAQPTSLSRRAKRSVASGKQAIDARLDLHGFTQSEAHPALLRFLRSASARDARLVLVITGKGRGGEPGVLRRQVPQWLGLPECRELVVGFEDAHVTHGGEGALYVRVRRARNSD
jgi:DNA-nicking Smr family endonuclease